MAKAAKDSMPFGLGVPKPMRLSPRDRQRSWVLAGLKHLRAPAVTYSKNGTIYLFNDVRQSLLGSLLKL